MMDPSFTAADPELDRRAGQVPYLRFLASVHERLQPELYLEIGVRTGGSLKLARCRSIAVDPRPRLTTVPNDASVYEDTSDDFFTYAAEKALATAPDLVFIDGMHLFEFVLRDFMNVERWAHAGTAVLIDDVFPNHPAQAERERRTRVWTGDVWKIADCLKRYRPDLQLVPIDTEPTGLLLVVGLDPTDRTLWAEYNTILERYEGDQFAEPPRSVLDRDGALAPGEPVILSLVDVLREGRSLNLKTGQVRRRLRAVATRRLAVTADQASVTAPHGPLVSIVVISFNMPRELPRTVQSLSPDLQQGVGPDDYEIIVVDNGSTRPFDRRTCTAFRADIRFLDVADPTASPARAVNAGLAASRAPLVGVMIDGARMASPGILRGALDAHRLYRRAIIATLGFHLGPDVQMTSVRQGYDAETEDRLLADIRWEEDPYRLFEIAVFAPSSRAGWFATPAESNALFLDRDLWSVLDGYDERFQSPGGGLVNLDTLERACALPDTELIILLGEGTFHQVHGGIATNALESPSPAFAEEYRRIRGRPFRRSPRSAKLFGAIPPAALPSLAASSPPSVPGAGRKAPHAGAAAASVPEGGAKAQLASPPRLTTPDQGNGPREFRSSLPPRVLRDVQHGTMRTMYRGVRFLKNPFDVVLYMQLLGRLRPRTVVEIGTKAGGSALWFADTLTAHGVDASIVSIDIDPQSEVTDPRITFIEGDANRLAASRLPALIAQAPRPWLVVEDSAHLYEPCLAVLNFFDDRLVPGDYIVIEDGAVGLRPGPQFAAYKNGPNRAVAAFLSRRSDRYQVDVELCDYYGENATNNPNGWLRRV